MTAAAGKRVRRGEAARGPNFLRKMLPGGRTGDGADHFADPATPAGCGR